MGKYDLREYQKEALKKAYSALDENIVENGETKKLKRFLWQSPTGSGKCTATDTLVWSRGLKRFDAVIGNETIAGPRGSTAVSGWYDDGKRDGHLVKLVCGLEIDGTPKHRLWTRQRSGAEGWVRTDQLTTDHYVAVARGRAEFGIRQIPLDEAYALGMVVADGSISRTNGGADERMQLDKQSPVIEAVLPVLMRWREWSGGVVSARPIIHHESDYHSFVQLSGKSFRSMLLERYEIDWQYSENRCVPPCVMQGTRDVVVAFLRGYFDGDGYADSYIAVSSASAQLAKEVHQLLLGLGIFAAIRTKETHVTTTHDDGSITRKPALDANIVEIRDRNAFGENIGFTQYGLKKDKNYNRLMSTKSNTNLDTVPGIGKLLRRCAKRVVKRTTRDDAWRHVDAYYDGKKMPGYSAIREWLAGMPECPERDELSAIATQHHAWSPVESVTPSYAHRMDCEVPDGHAFIGNGIVNHNTLLASEVIKRAIYKGKKVLFLAHRIELLTQPYNKLIEIGIPPTQLGIIRGGEKERFNPGAQVQIASIMSLIGRTLPDADIIIVDEAHRVCGESYTKVTSDPKYKNSTFVGLSATPLRTDGKPLRSAFQRIIVVAQPMELVEDGWIMDPTIFAPDDSALPDLSDVATMAGDFNKKQLNKVMTAPHLVGAIPQTWLAKAKGVCTMCFAAGIVQSKLIEAAFLAVGVRCKHIDGKTPDAERKQVLIDLAEGRLEVVTNANVFIEGIDVPQIKCVIMARPTKSLTIWLQSIGRGSRPWDNQKFIVLDHTNNNMEFHGHPYDDQEYSLDGRIKRAGGGVKRCPYPGCGAYARLPAEVCPFGHPLYDADAPPRVKRPMRTVAGELVEITKRNMKDETKHAAYDRLWMKAYADGSSQEAGETWVNAVYRSKFDEEPKWLPPARPTYTVEQKQKALNGWMRAAQISGIGIAWVRNKYETKFREPMPMDRMAEDALPLPGSEPEKEKQTELPVSVEIEL